MKQNFKGAIRLKEEEEWLGIEEIYTNMTKL